MSGIHHVTAISGKAARNLEFYQRVIGLRFVKKTVNFDDPSSYHFYYGDESAIRVLFSHSFHGNTRHQDELAWAGRSRLRFAFQQCRSDIGRIG